MIDKVKAFVIGSVVFVIGFRVFFALIRPYLPMVGQTLAYAAVVDRFTSIAVLKP